jgi:thioredoxin reductase/SAM-dependent methyltransferase
MDANYDVVVIGGGAAGLSGALALSRARRSVLVVDDGKPRNAPAGHVHNYLTQDGTPPGELLAAGRAEVSRYGGVFQDGRVDTVTKVDDGFIVSIGAQQVHARRLLVTTGATDELPDIPGVAERFGKTVLHCPYCHGYEVRDQRVGIVATGPLALHAAMLWRQWTPHVILFTNGAAGLSEEDTERLAAREVVVVEEPVTEFTGTAVRLDGTDPVAVHALVVPTRVNARSAVLEGLGLKPVDVEFGGVVMGTRIAADANGLTEVPGVYVAGNLATPTAQVITSAAGGLLTGAVINADLIAEDTAAAVADYRERAATLLDEDAWEERYQSTPKRWSGEPNGQLVAEVADRPAGRALDVAAGEGGDAIWLAQRGWQVTAVDISRTALARAEAAAREAGVADRITFTQVDLRHEAPGAAPYDLVTAQYFHLPSAGRREFFARLADLVAPGGTLLVVGHHPHDLRATGHRRHFFPDMMFTADDVAAALEAGRWRVVAADARARTVADADGNPLTIRDAVLVAERR